MCVCVCVCVGGGKFSTLSFWFKRMKSYFLYSVKLSSVKWLLNLSHSVELAISAWFCFQIEIWHFIWKCFKDYPAFFLPNRPCLHTPSKLIFPYFYLSGCGCVLWWYFIPAKIVGFIAVRASICLHLGKSNFCSEE